MKKTYPLVAMLLLVSIALQGYPFHFSTEREIFKIEVVERLILLKAKVNDDFGYFLFDTGSPQLVLNKKYFAASPEGEHVKRLIDVNGNTATSDQVFVRSFQMGSLSRNDFWSNEVNLVGLERKLNRRVLGLIGLEVIKNLEVLIDYHQSSMTLTKLDGRGVPKVRNPRQPDFKLNFQLGEFLPVLEVAFTNQVRVNLGLDTGSTLNLMDKQWQASFEELTIRKGKISYNGVLSTSRKKDYWLIPDVNIGNQVVWKFWKAAFSDFSHFRDYKVPMDGILGINFLRMGEVAINYRNRTISVWCAKNGYEGMYYGVVGETQ